MKRIITILIVLTVLLFMLAGPARPEQDVELFGYFESQVMGLSLDSEFFQMSTNKLRVDLKSVLSDRVNFAANFNAITYHGRTTWDILNFLTRRVAESVPEELESVYSMDFSDRLFLDNAYLRLSFEHFDLTLGKQQISFGTGYVWNPTDVFNIKDMLDPTYEQPGHNALRVDIPLSSGTGLTALYSPEETWKDSARLIRFKTRVGHFDCALIGIERVWRYHDYTRFDSETMSFLEMPEKRRLLGFSTAGELLGLGIWAEFAANDMQHSKDFTELVVGGDYTFDFQTYVMVEYYRNTLGKTDYRDYDLNDWMRLYTAELKAFSRDQLYAVVRHPVTDLMDLGLFAVVSLSDGSLMMAPSLQVSMSDHVELFAYLNPNFGREGKVFGKNLGSGGLLRLRVYF